VRQSGFALLWNDFPLDMWYRLCNQVSQMTTEGP
jgi:hypothetical protein